ncbi:MAG: RecQ family ATP-dependent DNA helicase [Gemmatimonadetes bacterium]|nr:RecQ family ATP-dependent DNA helicase [Candidatus Palauibacter rhopaloidicola]
MSRDESTASDGPAATLRDARDLLRDRFGYDDFRPAQARVVEAVLSGRDTLAVLPTGFGKSVCFQVPALLRPRATLVVSPLISLIEDQVAGAARRGMRVLGWTGATPRREVDEALERARRGELDLLYLAPERLENRAVCDRLREVGVAGIAVDEAHCVSQWGHDFRPSYLRIGRARERLGRPPLTALTATATWRTRREIERFLGMEGAIRIFVPANRPNLRYSVEMAADVRDAYRRVRREVTACGGASAVVYARTRGLSAQLAIALSRTGVPSAPYHARLPIERRQATQRAFLDGSIRVVCATTAFGMGIDHPHVRLVAHLGAPGSLEEYVQEAGRAGRDGEPARCAMVAIREKRRRALPFGRRERPRPGSPPPGSDRAAAPAERRTAMRAYIETAACRRAAIAAYFGERAPVCDGCDNCDRDRAAPGRDPGRRVRTTTTRRRWRSRGGKRAGRDA